MAYYWDMFIGEDKEATIKRDMRYVERYFYWCEEWQAWVCCTDSAITLRAAKV